MNDPSLPPRVAVLMGSGSDLPAMEGCTALLRELGIPHEVRVLSAHRTPEATRDYVLAASRKGIRIFIAGAGWAAHLAGFVAAHTILPVIGVPLDSSPLRGIDALLATLQMPPGIPVATMAVGKGGARNAALLAAQILALSDPELSLRLQKHREEQARQVLEIPSTASDQAEVP